jgi:hypothetical protein
MSALLVGGFVLCIVAHPAQDDQMEVSLLEEAAKAHHAAFASTDGDDPDWPLWYAQYLQPRLGGGLTVSEIVHRIVDAELQRRANDDPTPWPELYAARLDAPPAL